MSEDNPSSIDQMINLSRSFTSQVELGRNVSGEYTVSITDVYWKENRFDSMVRSIHGRGGSIIEACEDFMRKCKGKILFGMNEAKYGADRPEYICL